MIICRTSVTLNQLLINFLGPEHFETDFETERSCRFCCQFSVSLSVTSLHRHIDLTLSYDTLILSSNIIKAAVFFCILGKTVGQLIC